MDKIVIFLTVVISQLNCFLSSKRFQSSYCAKFRAGAKKKKIGRGTERGEEETPSLPSPSPVIPFFLLSSQLSRRTRANLNENKGIAIKKLIFAHI